MTLFAVVPLENNSTRESKVPEFSHQAPPSGSDCLFPDFASPTSSASGAKQCAQRARNPSGCVTDDDRALVTPELGIDPLEEIGLEFGGVPTFDDVNTSYPPSCLNPRMDGKAPVPRYPSNFNPKGGNMQNYEVTQAYSGHRASNEGVFFNDDVYAKYKMCNNDVQPSNRAAYGDVIEPRSSVDPGPYYDPSGVMSAPPYPVSRREPPPLTHHPAPSCHGYDQTRMRNSSCPDVFDNYRFYDNGPVPACPYPLHGPGLPPQTPGHQRTPERTSQLQEVPDKANVEFNFRSPGEIPMRKKSEGFL